MGRFDLIVLGEVLYFLDRASIVKSADHARNHLAAQGEVVACNWLAHIEGYGHSGEEVHRLFERALDLPRRFEYIDEDFVLTGWSMHASVASTDRDA
jgi:hypothetical protein